MQASQLKGIGGLDFHVHLLQKMKEPLKWVVFRIMSFFVVVAMNASAGIIRGRDLYAYREVSSIDEKRLMCFSVHLLLMHLLTLLERWWWWGGSLVSHSGFL